MNYLEVDNLVSELHDRLCRCGSRCDGWYNDRRVLGDWFEQRYGSVAVLEEALEAWEEKL